MSEDLRAWLRALDKLDEMAEGNPQNFFDAWLDLRANILQRIRGEQNQKKQRYENQGE